MTATMIDVAQIVDGYIAVWNETDGAARQALIAAGWTEDVSYTDPMADVSGREALDGLVAAVQAQFPGFVFRRLGEVEAHHEFLRFSWEAGPADGCSGLWVFSTSRRNPGRGSGIIGMTQGHANDPCEDATVATLVSG
jgi:hypothetical protein